MFLIVGIRNLHVSDLKKIIYFLFTFGNHFIKCVKTSQCVITQKYVDPVNDPELTAALEEVKIRVADKTSSDDE